MCPTELMRLRGGLRTMSGELFLLCIEHKCDLSKNKNKKIQLVLRAKQKIFTS